MLHLNNPRGLVVKASMRIMVPGCLAETRQICTGPIEDDEGSQDPPSVGANCSCSTPADGTLWLDLQRPSGAGN